MDPRADVRQENEARVAKHLARSGYAIIGRNVRVGRLEIDLIARRGSTIVFCEVRTRSNARMAEPVASIDRAKQLRLRRAAAIWMREKKLWGRASIRFDAASVVLDEDRLEYYEDAF